MIGHGQKIAATPLRAPRTGLLVAATVTDDDALVGQGGVAWLPELHPSTSDGFGAFGLGCDGNPAVPANDADNKAVLEGADPFAIYAFDWCSSFGYSQRDWVGRARRLLDATASHAIAKELWSGAVAIAETNANTWLGSATDSATAAALAPGKALAKLDEALNDALSNGQGMIHCRIEVLNRLVQAQAVRRDGAVWLTPSDNIVVADSGYSGRIDGDGANEWMIASTRVEVVRGAVFTAPDTLADAKAWAQAVDTANNDVLVLAQRVVLVKHEPNLALIRAQVDLS